MKPLHLSKPSDFPLLAVTLDLQAPKEIGREGPLHAGKGGLGPRACGVEPIHLRRDPSCFQPGWMLSVPQCHSTSL